MTAGVRRRSTHGACHATRAHHRRMSRTTSTHVNASIGVHTTLMSRARVGVGVCPWAHATPCVGVVARACVRVVWLRAMRRHVCACVCARAWVLVVRAVLNNGGQGLRVQTLCANLVGQPLRR